MTETISYNGVFIRGSNAFYMKLLKLYDVKILSKNWVFSSIRWLVNAKYREYCKLTDHLENQITNPAPRLVKLARQLRVFKNADQTALNILYWVMKNIEYRSESSEDWDNAEDVVINGYADCDGQNDLIWVLCHLAGISQFQIFCAIGNVTGGGHFWCLYYSIKHKKLISLDSTYYPSRLKIEDRPSFNRLNYHKDIWYLFNNDVCVRPN